MKKIGLAAVAAATLAWGTPARAQSMDPPLCDVLARQAIEIARSGSLNGLLERRRRLDPPLISKDFLWSDETLLGILEYAKSRQGQDPVVVGHEVRRACARQRPALGRTTLSAVSRGCDRLVYFEARDVLRRRSLGVTREAALANARRTARDDAAEADAVALVEFVYDRERAHDGDIMREIRWLCMEQPHVEMPR